MYLRDCHHELISEDFERSDSFQHSRRSVFAMVSSSSERSNCSLPTISRVIGVPKSSPMSLVSSICSLFDAWVTFKLSLEWRTAFRFSLFFHPHSKSSGRNGQGCEQTEEAVSYCSRYAWWPWELLKSIWTSFLKSQAEQEPSTQHMESHEVQVPKAITACHVSLVKFLCCVQARNELHPPMSHEQYGGGSISHECFPTDWAF